MQIYNPDRLSNDLTLFSLYKVLILGAGAVGTYIGEFLAKLGVTRITFVDFDHFTPANASKHSGIIRTPEDVGRPKSIATAERVQTLMVPGGIANGLDLSVTELGPAALSVYDAVFLALDNYAAKLVVNELLLSLPADQRPVIFMGGTNHELAQHNCLNAEKYCLRCLMAEHWLKHSTVRTSCTGPQLRQDIDSQAPVTSNLASCKAALLMVDDFRRLACGDSSVLNSRAAWFPGTHPRIRQSSPMPRQNCPDCASIHPPEAIISLSGSVYDTTLGQLMERVQQHLGHKNFELLPHLLRYGGAAYSGIIEQTSCRACGTVLPGLYRHESKTTAADLMCPVCTTQARRPLRVFNHSVDSILRVFTPAHLPEAAANKTLFSLGWPIGGYIRVMVRNNCFDLLDGSPETLTYTMAGDQSLVFQAGKENHNGI